MSTGIRIPKGVPKRFGDGSRSQPEADRRPIFIFLVYRRYSTGL